MACLKDKIQGVVAWYPVADLTLKPTEKQALRPYRSPKDLDDSKDWGPTLDWGVCTAWAGYQRSVVECQICHKGGPAEMGLYSWS